MSRVPGDSDVVSALKLQCDNWVGPSDVDTVSDPNIIASLLKLWYRELHEPLIPRQYYGRCVDAYSSADEAVQIVSILPHLNRLVLSYLVRFLQVGRSVGICILGQLSLLPSPGRAYGLRGEGLADWGGGMSASCRLRVQLFADAGNGWPHSALRYH